VTILIPSRKTVLPPRLLRRKRLIVRSKRNSSRVTVNHAIHNLIDIGERELAFGGFVFVTVKRLILSRLFGVGTCFVSAGDVRIGERRLL